MIGENMYNREYDYEVEENGDNVNIYFELPGYDKDNISVTIEGSTLSIAAERKTQLGVRSYIKQVLLNKLLDTSTCTAECMNGILKINMKMKESCKARRIPVN
jgi:HSP20 family molecular chaperone IbpA